METSPASRDVTSRPYLIGFVLALLLTTPTFAVIAVAAVAQVVVHLRYFLHLDLGTSSRLSLVTLAFAAVLMVIMIGGSVWILFDLNYRMV
jgi:cytochrome o ubiquinol oxidase operon protein cyoD